LLVEGRSSGFTTCFWRSPMPAQMKAAHQRDGVLKVAITP
jgi:hypothetical protein